MSSFPSWYRHSSFAAFVVVILVGIIGVGIFVLQQFGVLKNFTQTWSRSASVELNQPIVEHIQQQGALKKFSSSKELLAFLEKHSRSTPLLPTNVLAPTPLGFGDGFGGAVEDIASVPAYSPTNIQVPGVDEADIIKTDGKYIYVVVDQNLYIVEAYPPEQAKIVARIFFEGVPKELYIQDNFLAVYGLDWTPLDQEISLNRASEFTFFQVFDIQDKSNPKKIRDLSFEGTFFTSRRVGDYVYLVVQQYDVNPDPVMPIPYVLENGKALSTDSTVSPCNCPDVFYFDSPYNFYQFTTIAVVNMRKYEEVFQHQVYLLPGATSPYVSKDALYLTYTKYIEPDELSFEVLMERMFDRLSQDAKNTVWNIERVDEMILSTQEKRWKILEVFGKFRASLTGEERTRYDDEVTAGLKAKYKEISDKLEVTVIHKFKLDSARVVSVGVAEVTGRVNDQFSMDESGGYFRIATTKGPFFAEFVEDPQRTSWSNVYVLDEKMKVVGRLEGLAKGESNFASRFLGNRVYLVTFEQMDPLFAIDLSDPRQPTLLGELKLPGFSTYLHPYNENILIGLGHETSLGESDAVNVEGLKVSLFDVSNVQELREIDSYVIGGVGSDSEALREHKAFLFSKEKNLLVFPAQLQKVDSSDYEPVFEFLGALVFNINENGIELRERVNHSFNPISNDPALTPSDFTTSITRSLFIDDVLYTFSATMLQAHSLDDVSEKARVQFPSAFVPSQFPEPEEIPSSL